jgi:DNA-binding response OmpR family regulator
MNPTVLIVDDSLTVRMNLTEILENAGLKSQACATLAEARNAAEDRFALVILDILLPDGDGIELLEDIRATPSAGGPAVMMLSTEAEIHDRVRGLTIGADEYVGKPYEPAYVVARARELLRRSAEAPADPVPTPSAIRWRMICARRCARSTASASPCSRTTPTSSTRRACNICATYAKRPSRWRG